MFCKRCGAALPSEGYICKSCGAMMSEEQIKSQKEFINNENKFKVNLMSDKYNPGGIERDYKKRKDSRYLGILLVILIMVVIIIFAILKVM